MFRLELLQLVHQAVEFGVADFGIVEYEVAILVMAKLVAQGFELCLEVLVSHRQELIYRRDAESAENIFFSRFLGDLGVRGGKRFFSSYKYARSQSASPTGTQWSRRVGRGSFRRWPDSIG